MSRFASMDEFLQTWNSADKKAAIMTEFEQQGVLFEALADEIGRELDPFDLLCHIVYGQPPLTRRERAENVNKKDYFTKYGDQARAVLEALLEKYANQGILSIESMDVLKVDPLDEFGTPVEIIKLLGGKSGYLAALKDLEKQLYDTATRIRCIFGQPAELRSSFRVYRQPANAPPKTILSRGVDIYAC